MTDSVKTYPLFSELYQKTMYQHKLPNGNVIMHSGLPKHLAIKRMEDYKRWEQEHREELEVSSQQLWDDMFGG